jgi:hypothetical protein
VTFSVRGGGHSFAGYSSSTGLVISTSRLRRHDINEIDGRLVAGSGLTNADLVRLLPQGGGGQWVLPGGSCLSVGLAGLALGGGVGPNSSWAGLTADRLRSTTLVTADADIVTASETENADLFWGVRGAGGGNFGVHTDITFDMVSAPATLVTSGVLSVEGRENSVQAAMAWQRILNDYPRLVSGSYRIEAAGKRQVTGSARIQVLMPETDARAVLRSLLAVATSVDLSERTWWEAHTWYSYASPPLASNWYRSRFLYTALDEDVVDQQARHLERFDVHGGDRGAHLAFQGYVGGEVDAVPRTSSAYVHRGARMIVRQLVSWPTSPLWLRDAPSIPWDLRLWSDTAWGDLTAHTSEEAYQNFPDPLQPDWQAAYYGENLDRLSAIKRDYDPENVFSFAQSVPR